MASLRNGDRFAARLLGAEGWTLDMEFVRLPVKLEDVDSFSFESDYVPGGLWIPVYRHPRKPVVQAEEVRLWSSEAPDTAAFRVMDFGATP